MSSTGEVSGSLRVSSPDGEYRIAESLDVLGNAVAVHGLHSERLEDEHVERALEQLAATGTGGLR